MESVTDKKLRRSDYFVADCCLKDAQRLVSDYHYSKGGSNTAVYTHGLFRKSDGALLGVAWWLPPTKVACVSVNAKEWKKVLSLTRLVVCPDVPSNGATFLLGRSIKLIARHNRFVSLVTYADESQGHTGAIYRASNWEYVGRTGPYPRWVDSAGRQVAPKATNNRTKAQMQALGHRMVGRFYKHKFVIHLRKGVRAATGSELYKDMP